MDPTLLQAIHDHYLQDEDTVVARLEPVAAVNNTITAAISTNATALVAAVRARPERLSPLERLLAEYELTTSEGVLLMCLAETLLRVPDADTADLLIADKIKHANWEKHLGRRDLLVNASTWGLMLSGSLLPDLPSFEADPHALWRGLLSRLSEPVIRNTIRLAMHIIGSQFVLGETIEAALERARDDGKAFEDFSFDMLGEAALTRADAGTFLDAYMHAIETIGKTTDTGHDLGISVKLSALCPRFEVAQWRRAQRELVDKLGQLAQAARERGMALTVDAEESERLVLGLEVFADVLRDSANRGWPGFGLAVQAYQKRAVPVLHWLQALAIDTGTRIPVRLVKGAYWDTEIKLAQTRGLKDFPVFTRKCNTDLSYQAAVQTLAGMKDHLYAQFATHNAWSVASVKAFFSPAECEFQRLHGMGETLYDMLNEDADAPYRCRVYAPVGSHDALLPYLVRRLLENGANTSFVHRIADPEVPVAAIVTDPVAQVAGNDSHRHPAIMLPENLFGPARKNSAGLNLGDRAVVDALLARLEKEAGKPLPAYETGNGEGVPVLDPATGKTIGQTVYPDAVSIGAALDRLTAAWPRWERTPAIARAALLEKTADLLEKNQPYLISLCIREAGKTIADAHSEIREGVDFLRYYAAECRRLFGGPETLPGPVGEANSLRRRGRGVFFCINPWNFPVAIFTGQVAAALAAGNTVLAKPAEDAGVIARAVTALFHKAGIPEDVFCCVPGDGPTVARQVLPDERVAGVAFTGSGAVAKHIAAALAARPGAIPTLIAETGGLNAMLVDSTALPEQVVKDVVQSAFNSAGQRCSALRVLYLQEDIADRVLGMIRGRMDELVVGDPGAMDTDIGPVINAQAKAEIDAHIARAQSEGRLLYQVPRSALPDSGFYVAPAMLAIDSITDLDKEVFGPVLHVIRYKAEAMLDICDAINATGYALTFGIHSRINHRIDAITQRIHAGNVYINRNMVGAVVGSQPFGGSGLSGTGPKAGGPEYLARFGREQSLSNNTAAIGGDPAVFSISE